MAASGVAEFAGYFGVVFMRRDDFEVAATIGDDPSGSQVTEIELTPQLCPMVIPAVGL